MIKNVEARRAFEKFAELPVECTCEGPMENGQAHKRTCPRIIRLKFMVEYESLLGKYEPGHTHEKCIVRRKPEYGRWRRFNGEWRIIFDGDSLEEWEKALEDGV